VCTCLDSCFDRVELSILTTLAYYTKASRNRTLKNVNSFQNNKITLYSETSGSQNSNLLLNVVYFFYVTEHYISVSA
jgi:hypothetical protein